MLRENTVLVCGEHYSYSGGLEPDAVSRIHLGWNLALDEPILELLQRMKSVPADGRDYDITCRATVPQDNWLRHLQIPAISTIEAMSARFQSLAARPGFAHRLLGRIDTEKICVKSLWLRGDLLAGFRGYYVWFAPYKTRYEPS